MGLFGKKYDSKGFDKKGKHENGTRWNPKGQDYWGRYISDSDPDLRIFNKQGINKITGKKYDVYGYDESGYNKDGFDKYEIHKETGTEYDKDGFDKSGFNTDGIHKITRTKYDQRGYPITRKSKPIESPPKLVETITRPDHDYEIEVIEREFDVFEEMNALYEMEYEKDLDRYYEEHKEDEEDEEDEEDCSCTCHDDESSVDYTRGTS